MLWVGDLLRQGDEAALAFSRENGWADGNTGVLEGVKEEGEGGAECVYPLSFPYISLRHTFFEEERGSEPHAQDFAEECWAGTGKFSCEQTHRRSSSSSTAAAMDLRAACSWTM